MREAVVTWSARATLELIVGGGWLATLATLAVATGAVAASGRRSVPAEVGRARLRQTCPREANVPA